MSAIPAGMLPQPDLRPIPGRPGHWRLQEAYRYRDVAVLLTVPAGHETNLASIPRLVWPLLNRDELGEAGPLVHDFLYACQGCPGGAAEPRTVYTRSAADAVFRRILEEDGVARWRREAAYAAVRYFGANHWGHR